MLSALADENLRVPSATTPFLCHAALHLRNGLINVWFVCCVKEGGTEREFFWQRVGKQSTLVPFRLDIGTGIVIVSTYGTDPFVVAGGNETITEFARRGPK